MRKRLFKYLSRLIALLLLVISATSFVRPFPKKSVNSELCLEQSTNLKVKKALFSISSKNQFSIELLDEVEEEEDKGNKKRTLSQSHGFSQIYYLPNQKIRPIAYKFSGQKAFKWYLLYDVFLL